MTNTPTRECGTCTACCEGWLRGVVRGHEMNRGKKCHFLGCKNTRCSIYEERPEEPCKNFECVWLKDTKQELPEWMKPELSKVIIKEMEYEVHIRRGGLGTASYILENAADMTTKGKYWNVVEMDETISGPVLNWLIQHSLSNGIPIVYMVNGAKEAMGPPEFMAFFEQTKNRQF